jgi:demethylmenaquinone methyltransferase/2-methoxy-6-polyprenyl-1,4-benzoquinol methylase
MPIATQRVRAEYNRIAPIFSLGSSLIFPHRRELIAERVLPRLTLTGGETVVDLGCGAGHNFPYLQRVIGPKGRLIGVDLSENMLARAQHRIDTEGWSNVALVLGDASDLRFLQPNSIDIIFCSLALSILPDRVLALESIKHLLRPHGQLAVIDWKPFSGLLRVLNPLIYLSMLPLPSTNIALRRSSQTADLVKHVFPKTVYEEYYGGSLYVVLATNAS